MIERDDFISKYWNYYLMLERKFIETLQYVEISENNYATFSNEYALLIQAIGSELDSVFKVYCSLDSNNEKININNYVTYLSNNYSNIKEEEIFVAYTDITLCPFNNLDYSKPKQSLLWWDAFDNIKHKRTMVINKANLENTINILAALFLLEMKYIKNIGDSNGIIDIPNEESKLFELKKWSFNTTNMSKIYTCAVK